MLRPVASSPAARALALVLIAAAALPSRADADAAGAVRVAVTAGVDTNPARNFTETGTAPDGMLSALAAAKGSFGAGWLAGTGSVEAGGRKYLLQKSEDTFVSAADVELSARLGKAFRAGILGAGKDRGFGNDPLGNDRLGGERPYSDLTGLAFLAFAPDRRVEVRAMGGAQRFIYWPAQEFNFGAAEVGARVRYRIDAHHALSLEGGLSQRTYGGLARPVPSSAASPFELGRREDTVLTALVGYTFRGPLVASASYGFVGDDSNSFGESLQRHRVTVQAALRLPWQLTFVAEASLQFTRYPDGVYLSPEVQLIEDTESWNSVSAQLSRPLFGPLEVAASYLINFGQLTANGLSYNRQLATVGLVLRLDGAIH